MLRPLIPVYLFISAIYYVVPMWDEVDHAFWNEIYYYKSFVSMMSIFGIYMILKNKRWLAHILAATEGLAIIAQIVYSFTPFSQHFPMWGFEVIAWVYDNYKQIPFWLYLAQVAILVTVGLSGICARAGAYLKRFIRHWLNNRGGDYRLSAVEKA